MFKIIKIQYVALVCAFCFIAFIAVQKTKNIPFDLDEISWYYHTKFFEEAFIYKNIYSELWNGYESYDHPQISKYIYGSYLYILDPNFSIKRNILEEKYGRWQFYYNKQLAETISPSEFFTPLSKLRDLNRVFLIGIFIEVFIVMVLLTKSYIYSVILMYVLAVNTMFINAIMRITSDIHMIFFGLFAMIFYLFSLKKQSLSLIAISSIFTAVSIGSKLNGVFISSSIICLELLVWLMDYSKIIVVLKRILAYIVICFFIWIMINPALYSDPIQRSWKYFTFRTFQTNLNAKYHPSADLDTPLKKAQAIFCNLVVRSCKKYPSEWAVTSNDILNILLVCSGFMAIYSDMRKKQIQKCLLVLLEYIILFNYLLYLQNYSSHYYVFPQIFLFMIQILGLKYCIEIGYSKVNPAIRRGLKIFRTSKKGSSD